MTAEPLVAIDFGTSYSSAVLVIEDHIVPVKEPATHGWSFPSSVCQTDTELLVAAAAENAKRGRPEGYRTEFKRDFGQAAPVELGGIAYPVAELVAALFTSLREEAERIANQPVRAAVLTVPVGYGPAQRDLMIAAGRAAGLTGPVTVLDEPIAAAFCPAHGPALRPGELMLVYDLGGGTFDAALLTVTGSGFTVSKAAGLTACGGGDVDRLLYSWLRAEAGEPFQRLLDIAPDADAVSRRATRELQQSLLEFLRIHVKHQLSSAGAVDDSFAAGPLRVPVKLQAARFRSLIEPIIADTLACCRELVRASGHEVADLAAILLVGGGTRMPSVTEALRAEFGRPLRYVEDPELAVALGAAYRTCQQPGQRTRLVESIAVPGGLTSLAVAPDGPGGTPTAVTGGLDGTLRIWRLDDGTPGPSLAAHDGIVSTLDISADGAVVVSGGQDGAVHVWNPGPGTARTICYHSGWVTTVRISADGGLVFSVGDDGYWRCSPLTGARAAGNGQRVRGDRAASRRARDGAADGQLRGARPAAGSMSTSRPGLCAIADSAGLIQLTNRRQVSAGPAAGTISAVALDAAGQRLAAGYAQGALRVWQLPKSKPFLEVSAEPDGVAPVRDLRFSPGGRLVSGHGDGSVRVWNLDQPTRPAVVGSHEGQVRSVAFPTDELAVSGGADGRIRVWPARVLEREPKPPSPLHSPVARQPGQEGVLP